MSGNPFTGLWLRNSLKLKFPEKQDCDLAAMLGITPQSFANWAKDDGVARMPKAEILYRGYQVLGILPGEWSDFPDGGRPFAGVSEWPVRGMAAADDSNGSRVPDTDESGDAIFCPPGLTLVPVQGDSMSPLVLPGQYVMIDREREGFEANGGVVVVSIADPDWERRERMPGTFVKRCFAGDGFFFFTSINSAYSPFSAWRENCRVWPVLGVWFAGRGRPPRDAW